MGPVTGSFGSQQPRSCLLCFPAPFRGSNLPWARLIAGMRNRRGQAGAGGGCQGSARAARQRWLVSASLARPISDRRLGDPFACFNSGGLDWDRPVYGRFGPFTGGMFGLWPVYSRADGYDFDTIDKAPTTRAVAPASLSVASVGAALSVDAPARRSASLKDQDDLVAAQPAPVRRGHLDPAAGPTGGLDVESAAAAADITSPRRETIEPADLQDTQTLVLINSPKIWDDREQRTIYDFVGRGGSLLVLGDHTDVFGLMRGFNSLLGPVGIQFRFDSVHKARQSWRGCQAAAPDAVAWGWDEENPGVAVGASLQLSGSARPLLVGRYAFSDKGARENVVGSYLGNYHFDVGERLGDLVLVATATHGRGRVVVWGDTSAFQGVSYYYSDVVSPMLAWLSRPAAWTERPPVRAAAAIGLLVAIAWLWLSRGGACESAVIALGLLLGLGVPWYLSRSHREARLPVSDDTVLFDRSHLPLIGHYGARVNPIGPLNTNLMRSGFRVGEMRNWDSAAIGRAKGVAFVAPQRSFTAAEVQDLLRAEGRGAVVILAAGQPDSDGSRRLLHAHDLALAPKPLGTVTSADPGASRREREAHPRLLDAWPIVRTDGGSPAELPGVQTIYRRGRDVVALFRRMGAGGLLLIADTRFFSDMNVEGISGPWIGNLALIHDMFENYLGAEADATKPVFRSPTKPP